MSFLPRGRERRITQNTQEWLDWRKRGIGGSEAGIIKLGEVFGKTVPHLWAQKTEYAEGNQFSEKQQEHIDRGHEHEPAARAMFEAATGFVVTPVCMESSVYPFMLASLDGMTLDRRVGVEIKSHSNPVFERLMKSQKVAEYYEAQIQHQLAVTGADEFYFFAYNPNIAPHYFIKKFTPDYAYIEDLIRREESFWRHVEAGICPVTDEVGEAVDLGDSKWYFSGLVMLSGFARVGKDTAIANTLRDTMKMTRFAFADKLKEVYCQMHGLSREQLEKTKEKHRPGLVALGHGMRQAHPNVWVEAVLNENSGILRAMEGTGAFITDARYLNEISAGEAWAKRVGVPFRHIHIIRPGVEAANDTEGLTVPMVAKHAHAVFNNDADIETAVGREATKKAVLSVLRTARYKTGNVVKASLFESKEKNASKSKDRKSLRGPVSAAGKVGRTAGTNAAATAKSRKKILN